MDKLLKHYAEKRRREAGAPLELHPATRHLFQDEVAGLRPRGSRSERRLGWFPLLNRLSFAGAILAGLGIIGWTLVRTGEKPDPGFQLARQDRPTPSAQPAPISAESENRIGQDPPLPSGELQKQKDGLVRLRAEGADSDKYGLAAKSLGDTRSKQNDAPATPLPEMNSLAERVVEDETLFKRMNVEAAMKDAGASRDRRSLTLSPSPTAPAGPVIKPEEAFALLPGGTTPAGVGAQKAFGLSTNSSYGSSALSAGLADAGLRPNPTLLADGGPPTASSSLKQEALKVSDGKAVDAVADRTTVPGEKIVAESRRAAASVSASPDRRPGSAGIASQSGVVPISTRGRFRQISSALEPQKNASDLGFTILARFELEQTSERVRVVDEDGSVYDGQLLTGNTREETARVDIGQKTTSKPAEPASPVVQTDQMALGGIPRSFRASGMNRTLQQRVVVEGVLLAEGVSTGSSNQAGGPASLPPERSSVARNVRPSPSQSRAGQALPGTATTNFVTVQRIQGKVRVGTTTERQLDAVSIGSK